MRSGALALALALALCGAARAVRPRCRLVVIGAGTPRTGSTHEMRLARLSLRELGFGRSFDDAGYWKWHEHTKMSADETRKHLEGEQARAQARRKRAASALRRKPPRWNLRQRAPRRRAARFSARLTGCASRR